MNSGKSIVLSAIAVLIFSTATAAQRVTFDGCSDINGVQVASVSNTSIQDVAMATIASGRPIILYNPVVLANTRSQTRLFFYAHECGHHALGHTLSGLRLGQEQEADCWAINKLVELELLADRDISLIQSDIAQFGRGDWTHLPGPQRAINLRRCLDKGDDSKTPDGGRSQSAGHWEVTECKHPAHPNGDVGPCQHTCWNAYGQAFPCHRGDVYPCVHKLHPDGDRTWIKE